MNVSSTTAALIAQLQSQTAASEAREPRGPDHDGDADDIGAAPIAPPPAAPGTGLVVDKMA